MSKSFEDIIIDEFVNLKIKLHFPRVSEDKYVGGLDGTIDRLKDEIKIEYLTELIRMNPDWDAQEMSIKASEKIRKKTSIY